MTTRRRSFSFGLQAQFKQKKPPKTYRYDPSLDPALSWDINADRERAEALIAKIEKAKDIAEAKLGFAIPYSHNCEAKGYIPDFLIRLRMNGGRDTDPRDKRVRSNGKRERDRSAPVGCRRQRRLLPWSLGLSLDQVAD